MRKERERGKRPMSFSFWCFIDSQ